MSRYERFDRNQITLKDVSQRGHDIVADACLPLEPPTVEYEHPEFDGLINKIVEARQADRPVILMTGAHPIKLGLSRFLVDLIRRRVVTHIGTNGAGMIHDFELATIGGTSEDVAKWIREGQFGLWQQTSRLNDIAVEAAKRDEGLGEAVGRTISEDQTQNAAPHSELSLAAAAWQSSVPFTVHVAMGCDIVHAHANFDPAAVGKATYNDFLIFARTVQDLEGGVFLNIGTSTIGPEVYLKSLSMARNVAIARGEMIRNFTTTVFDLVELPNGWRDGPPCKAHPQYYYRPWKTILARTVADGGTSFYFRGDHTVTIPTLWQRLTDRC